MFFSKISLKILLQCLILLLAVLWFLSLLIYPALIINSIWSFYAISFWKMFATCLLIHIPIMFLLSFGFAVVED